MKWAAKAATVLERGLALDIEAGAHHRAVHATATRASIQPDNGSLAVRNVSVLVEPEEHVAVVFRCDLYMSSVHVE